MNPEMRHDNPGWFNLLFGAYGFPVGLSMCVINGASLFTSNIAYMMVAFMERKSTTLQSLWIVWLSYFTNLAGEAATCGGNTEQWSLQGLDESSGHHPGLILDLFYTSSSSPLLCAALQQT